MSRNAAQRTFETRSLPVRRVPMTEPRSDETLMAGIAIGDRGAFAELVERHLPRITAMYGRKCMALCESLRAQLGDALQFHRPEGGMFVWARLSGEYSGRGSTRDGIDASALLQRAIDNKVIFVPGKAFYADNVDTASLRLSFAAPGMADIEEGARRLKRAYDA